LADAQAVPADPVAGLIDIPLPPPVSLWPQTWTSRIAIAVILIVAVVGTWRFVHQRWVNRYRREALAELDQIERRLDEKSTFAELTATLAVLVRRTALAAFPREQVAALAGSAWLSFLDRSYGGADFSQGPGRALAGAPYQPAQPDDNELKPLLALVRRWITVHHA
jgi:Domain of unknown function (DUF4381)